MRRPGVGIARRSGWRGFGGGAAAEPAVVDDPPSAPANLVVTPGDASLALNWDDSADGDFANFVVEYKLASEPTVWTAHSTPAVSNATISSLTNYLSYDVRVRTVDDGANESSNTTGSGTPTWAPLDDSPAIYRRYQTLTTHYTLNGTDVASLKNQGSTGATNDMTQGSAGPQPAFTLSNATWNNKSTATYTADSLIEGTMSANYQPLYDGTGAYMFVIFRATSTAVTQIIWTCGGNSTTTAGIRFMYNGSTEKVTIQASNDSAFVINTAISGTVPLNTKGIMLFRYQHGRVGLDDWELFWNGSKVGGGDSNNTPATGVGPDVLPCFGATSATGATNPFGGDIVESGSKPVFASDALVAKLYAYAQNYYGVT